MTQETETPKIKFVDKRRFDEQGEDRADVVEAQAEPEAKTAPKSEPKVEDAPPKPPKLNFPLFVQSLGHQAMVGLGIIPAPGAKEPATNLPLAEQTIDILGMLQEKTKGNLSKDEENLLSGLLYEVRVAFVEIQKKDGAKPLDIPAPESSIII